MFPHRTEGTLKARRNDAARACRQGTRGRYPEDCEDCDLQGMRVSLLPIYAKKQRLAGALSGLLQSFALGFL